MMKMTGKPSEKPRQAVAEVCAKWREKFMPAMAPITQSKLAILFEKHICPSIGALDVGNVTSEIMMRDLLSPIENAGHLETAHRVKSTLSRVLRLAMGMGIVDEDATMPLMKTLETQYWRF